MELSLSNQKLFNGLPDPLNMLLGSHMNLRVLFIFWVFMLTACQQDDAAFDVGPGKIHRQSVLLWRAVYKLVMVLIGKPRVAQSFLLESFQRKKFCPPCLPQRI
jgi:hypothetical protein